MHFSAKLSSSCIKVYLSIDFSHYITNMHIKRENIKLQNMACREHQNNISDFHPRA